jgi:hypothetical protein
MLTADKRNRAAAYVGACSAFLSNFAHKTRNLSEGLGCYARLVTAVLVMHIVIFFFLTPLFQQICNMAPAVPMCKFMLARWVLQ